MAHPFQDSMQRLRSIGVRQYALNQGWDADAFLALLDDRTPVTDIQKQFKRKDGRTYSLQWLYAVRTVRKEERGRAAGTSA